MKLEGQKVKAGDIFGRLIVLRIDGRNALCRCHCGTVKWTRTHRLRSGDTRSCGCLARELAGQRLKGNAFTATHGKTDTPEYVIWGGMIQRCTNPKHASFANYGGRGITVCDEWHSFENFIRDMGLRPSKAYSIERKDNDGPYCPTNCRWATRKEQNGNSRHTRKITFRDECLMLVEWAARTGISAKVIAMRLRRGWGVERTLTTSIAEKEGVRC